MTGPTSAAGTTPTTKPERSSAARRNQLFTAVALGLTAAGVVLAVLQPPWLTGPLQSAVASAGDAAPLVFVLLCVVAAPAHLSGVLVALGLLVWPVPVAASLAYVGGLLGCVLTAALLARAGTRRARQRDGWPAWLERLADRVAHRPLLVGIAVRLVLQSGVAVEAFYLLTGYTRRTYLVVTTVGCGLWLAQTLIGITALAAAVKISPWLGALLVVIPLAAVGVTLALRRTPFRPQSPRTTERSEGQR